MNGYKITVNITTTECTSKVLEKALKSVDLPEEYIFYFGLFLMRREADGSVTLVKKLMDFESPFVSLRTHEDCQIVIRKNYWDANYDGDLMRDPIALNLLYIQAQSDVERGWTVANSETRQTLTSLHVAGKKIDFMNIVKNLPCYGCLQFADVLCDFPEMNLMATIVVGNQELGIRVSNGPTVQETKFRVTRMRCWRVTTILSSKEKAVLKNDGSQYSYELSFEYLMAKNCLKWIKLVTEQAMLISVCLQVSWNLWIFLITRHVTIIM